jgi:hypothetical protein
MRSRGRSCVLIARRHIRNSFGCGSPEREPGLARAGNTQRACIIQTTGGPRRRFRAVGHSQPCYCGKKTALRERISQPCNCDRSSKTSRPLSNGPQPSTANPRIVKARAKILKRCFQYGSPRSAMRWKAALVDAVDKAMDGARNWQASMLQHFLNGHGNVPARQIKKNCADKPRRNTK